MDNMDNIVKTLEGGKLLLSLSKKIYEKEAIFATNTHKRIINMSENKFRLSRN